MNRWISVLATFCLLAIGTSSPADLQPATRPANDRAGTIEGSIHLPDPQFTSQIVVYLEPGEGQAVSPPLSSAKVSQKGAKFRPALLVVCLHQTVDFLNDEDRPIDHNVFSNSPAAQFDFGLFKPGEKRSMTFDKTGPVLLYCSIHRHMDGEVYVTPTPYFAVIEPDKGSTEIRYRIEDVPRGRWTVHTWQRRRRCQETSAAATTRTGETCRLDLQLGVK